MKNYSKFAVLSVALLSMLPLTANAADRSCWCKAGHAYTVTPNSGDLPPGGYTYMGNTNYTSSCTKLCSTASKPVGIGAGPMTPVPMASAAITSPLKLR